MVVLKVLAEEGLRVEFESCCGIPELWPSPEGKLGDRKMYICEVESSVSIYTSAVHQCKYRAISVFLRPISGTIQRTY